jgi:hypothetical protein
MSGDFDSEIIEAAKRYRDVHVVPKARIWERIDAARRPRRRGWREFRAAALLLVAGGALALAGEYVFEHRQVATGPSAHHVPPAVASYLASSDSLLSVFRLSGDGGRLRADVAAWARDLASRTGGLEESLTARDTTLRRLLVDIDLILIQIAQYAGSPDVRPMERTLIEDALDARRITAQLRAAMGSASHAGGGL